MLPGLIMIGLLLMIAFGLLALKIYGVILCFQKKWYIGVVALLCPLMAEIIAIAKLAFKKDLLNL